MSRFRNSCARWYLHTNEYNRSARISRAGVSILDSVPFGRSIPAIALDRRASYIISVVHDSRLVPRAASSSIKISRGIHTLFYIQIPFLGINTIHIPSQRLAKQNP